MDLLAAFGRSFVCARNLMNHNIFYTGQKFVFISHGGAFKYVLLNRLT